MKKAEKDSVAPYIGCINKVYEDFEVLISFWDGKQCLSSKQKSSMKKRCSSFGEAEDYFINYLKGNKPMDNFVLFTNDADLLD
jgi:hypothetical protein